MTTPDKIQHELDKFSEAASRLRDLITAERPIYTLMNREKKCFPKVLSGMDYIGDILLGFQGYLERDDSCEVRRDYYLYVEIIGILNCMYIQQNIIRDLHKIIIGSSINLEKEYQGIKEIRTVRNAIAGHPLDSNEEAHFINRNSLSKWSFERYCFDENMDMKTERVELAPFLYHQAKALNHVLKKIIDHMEAEDKEHKKQFRDKKLVDIFLQHNDLLSELSKDGYKISHVHIKTIQGLLNKFESALLERGEHFLEAYWFRADMPLIREALSGGSEFSNADDDSCIDASFVAEKLKELKNMAQEIDADYSN